MNRVNIPSEQTPIKATLAERLCVIRRERFGSGDVPEVARLLGLSPRTWLDIESGVTIPVKALLRFIKVTHVDPFRLLRGHGRRYRAIPETSPSDADSARHRTVAREIPRA
jgi:hypothetical protein